MNTLSELADAIPLHTVLQSDDFDQWRASLSALLGEHRSELLSSPSEVGRHGFRAHLRAGQIDAVRIVAIDGVGSTRLDRHQALDSLVLWLPRMGWVRERADGEEVLAEPGMAMLCRPGMHLRGESSARLHGLSLILPVHLLASAGFDAATSGRIRPVLLAGGAEALAVIQQAQRLAGLVSGATAGPAGLHAPEEVQRLCETLIDWEKSQVESATCLALPSRSAAVVAEAEAFMAARLGEPLRIADLARHLSLTPRSLQLAFQRERGCSPMQRLKRLRQQALHSLLRRPALGAVPLEALLASVGLPGYGRIRAEFRAWCGSSPQELRHQALVKAFQAPQPRSTIGSTRVTSE